MRFTYEDIFEPDAKLELTDWSFHADLRNYFHDLPSNNEIGELLKERKVIGKNDTFDCESACTYVYFKSKRAVEAFLKRLNAMPEIHDVDHVKEKTHVITASEWERLSKFLHKTLTKKQFQKLRDLEIELHEGETWLVEKRRKK
jgi:hypothetical protein